MAANIREIRRKKLQSILSKADDEPFLRMIWCTDAIQSGNADAARRYFHFPKEAVDPELDSQYAIYKWELETLINAFFITAKARRKKRFFRFLNCTQFSAMASIVNALREFENEEYKTLKEKYSVFIELNRIAQRQFHWQRGYFNTIQLYRSFYIYGQGACADHFKEKYGINIDDFTLAGFALYCRFQKTHQLLERDIEQTLPNIENINTINDILCMNMNDARKIFSDNYNHINWSNKYKLPIAYTPNPIRLRPVFRINDAPPRYLCPIPECILIRITSGLYYDIITGGTSVINNANNRFEEYGKYLIEKLMPDCTVITKLSYTFRKNKIDAPDILLLKGTKLKLVIECKATKLTAAAKFSQNPISEAENQFKQIAKGVFQIWKYFAHLRMNVCCQNLDHYNARGLLLTLDEWLMGAPKLQERVIELAHELANQTDYIEPNDRRTVIFCPIADFETILMESDSEKLFTCVEKANEPNFWGWGLPQIFSQHFSENQEPKDFPFNISDIMPAWKNIDPYC